MHERTEFAHEQVCDGDARTVQPDGIPRAARDGQGQVVVPDAGVAGADDRGRHQRNPAQYHRRARARIAEGLISYNCLMDERRPRSGSPFFFADCWPVPDKLTVCGPLELLLSMVRTPLLAPAATGAKTTE